MKQTKSSSPKRRWFSLFVLAIGLFNLAGGSAYGDDVGDLKKKQIGDIEKQIEELKAQLQKLKDAPSAEAVESYAKHMGWRCIGPANMGGRITSIAVFEADPSTFWAATASGGLIKTTNNGSNFEHQFDKESTVSIGAVAVAPSDKNIVWVGTGEANPRNSVSWGDGVYKSVDGGKTWKNMGLAKSFQIGKIVVHPKNPDIVYVAALGRLYGTGGERGVFKTTDGGKTWTRVLTTDDKTGVLEIAMKPDNPESLLVATWERQRDEFDSFLGEARPSAPEGADEYAPAVLHAPGTGIYKTADGGKTFNKVTKGLPNAKLGRIGIDYSRKNPNTVFAIVDSEKTGLGTPPTRVYMGIQGENDKAGAKLTSVTEKAPAAKAGLKAEDIITKFGGKEIKSYDELRAEIVKRKVNDKVKVAFLRGMEKKEAEVTLEGQPLETRQGGQRRPPTFGVTSVDAVEGGGIKISTLAKESTGEKAGLKVGDIINSIDGTKLTDNRSLVTFLAAKKGGDKVKVKYVREKDEKELEIALVEAGTGGPRPNNGPAGLGGQRANVQDTQGPEGNDTGGIYRSDDNGDSWTRVNSLNERPFYFSVIRVDATEDKKLYAVGYQLNGSVDGGKTFSPENLNKGVHSDLHDMWIDPRDPKHLLIGTDGGIYASYDRGANWEHINTMDMGQFYHVAVDTKKPYNVYGGLQDNGTWGGPSETNRFSGPRNEDFGFYNGGDGFVCRVDPTNPDILYCESQDGAMTRRDLKTGGGRFIRPRAVAGLSTYRFNWNTPFILSSHNPRIFYSAGNYVFKSIKQGEDQKPISPEITRTKRGSGTALAESPLNPDVLWVGTDDGAVQVTKDGGKTWVNVSDNFKKAGLPGPRWVASIEASKAKEGRAYVAFDAHRSNDDEPYLFVTEDFGATWTSLRGNLPAGSTRVLREDILNPNLLYCGTEFAAWASVNRGKSWFKLNGGALPTVAIHEFAQPTTANEIVLATHGRSIWIGDVTALRQVTDEVAAGATTLFKPSPVIRWQLDLTKEGMFATGTRAFQGKNSERSANIDYALGKKPEKITLKIVDIKGDTLRSLAPTKNVGANRVSWDLRQFSPRAAGVTTEQLAGMPFAQDALVQSPAGTYRVVLSVDGKEYSQALVVENDPNTGRAGTGRDEAAEERFFRKTLQGTMKNIRDAEREDN